MYTATSSSVDGTNISGSDREVVDLTGWGIFGSSEHRVVFINLKGPFLSVIADHKQFISEINIRIHQRRRRVPGNGS